MLPQLQLLAEDRDRKKVFGQPFAMAYNRDQKWWGYSTDGRYVPYSHWGGSNARNVRQRNPRSKASWRQMPPTWF